MKIFLGFYKKWYTFALKSQDTFGLKNRYRWKWFTFTKSSGISSGLSTPVNR